MRCIKRVVKVVKVVKVGKVNHQIRGYSYKKIYFEYKIFAMEGTTKTKTSLFGNEYEKHSMKYEMKDLENEIHKHTKDGWRFIQLLPKSHPDINSGWLKYENCIIFERETDRESVEKLIPSSPSLKSDNIKRNSSNASNKPKKKEIKIQNNFKRKYYKD